MFPVMSCYGKHYEAVDCSRVMRLFVTQSTSVKLTTTIRFSNKHLLVLFARNYICVMQKKYDL